MDINSKYIFSALLLATLINFTFEKRNSDIDNKSVTALETSDHPDESMNHSTVATQPSSTVEATTDSVPQALTNSSGTLVESDPSVMDSENSTFSTKICRNIDVRNKVANLEVLRGCREVRGFVQIVLIDLANETDFDNYSFPELVEVSQYLLFYRVSGLRSLGQLFPSLALVRGSVVFQDYALVVYEMFHLQEIGLTSLAEISRGAVRIERNPSLCFVNTINWGLIARWDSVKNYVNNNKSPDDCPTKTVCEEAGCPLGLCWTSSDCQVQSSDVYRDCHAECIGGCSGPGPKECYACRKYLTLDMECISSCSNGTYIHLDKRCVTKEHCLSLSSHQSETSENANFVTFNGTCVQDCPPGYEYTADRQGCDKCAKGKCRKVCQGLKIESIESAQNLKDCTYINGSLEITIKQGNHKILAKALEESLGSIEEIVGYLKIVRCFPLVHLKFLDKLERIHGHGTLENDKYSLIVLENQNLQELWDITSNFKILNGRIFFHYNPKLCFYYIENLIFTIDLKNINDFEVSPTSNGDKFACNITDIDLRFELITSNSVVISITLPNPTNGHNNLGRYVLYYTEASGKILNLYEEVDGCGDDHWKVRDVLIEPDGANQPAFTVQPSLKPFTRYAFYVKTYTTQTIGGLSPIYYIHTLPSRPSEVVINMYYSNTSSTIVLEWEPPRYHNGILTEYIVSGYWQQDDRAVLDQRNYCEFPLEEETVEVLSPDFQTNIEFEKKSCCPENEMVYRPYGEFGRLCENLGLRKWSVIDENEHYPISSCSSYLYDYIEETYFMLNNSRIHEKNSNTSKITNNLDKNKKSYGLIQNKSFIEKLHIGRSKRGNSREKFYQIAKYDTKTFVINNLQHFAKYTIFVSACRKIHRSENHDDYDERCSKSEILTVRTLKDPQADLIDETQVVYKILEKRGIHMIQINWVEPADPNGLVLSFQIEHQSRDLKNATVITSCLTYLEYTQNGKMFVIKGLTFGSYFFRLRAVSLAGAGPFTNSFHFEIKNVSKVYFSKIFIFCTVTLMFVVAGISACYFVLHQRRQYFSDLDELLSNINNEHTSAPFLDDSWEVPKENVQILKLIGQGSFGKVYEGILHPLKLSCAIKTVGHQFVDKEKFLNEIKVLKHTAGVHHMVQLLGVVFQIDPLLVVMELMILGDLKSFLHSVREVPLQDFRIFRIAAEIADAMFFMEQNRFVHRDLAARNCMVHKNLTVKVGDYGLACDVYPTDYYRKSSKEQLPIRWMAPESLKDGIYTSHSDVWSYGVVLWEIATLAEQPYRGLTNEQVLQWVIGGEVLYTPVFCPNYLKTIMELSWNRNPNQRPTFRQMVSQLEQYTDNEFKCVSYYNTVISKSR